MTLPLITEHFDLWTSTVRAKSTSGRGSNSKIELAGIKKLRELILELAVRGKLVPQNPDDEPASALLARIEEERTCLVAEGKLKKQKPLPPVRDEERPFELPEGWEWVRFGNVTFNRDAERIPLSVSEREHRRGQYDYYGASGVIDSIDDYLFDKPLLLIGEDGANLINRSTPIAFIARGKYWVNNHAHVIDGISEEFLMYVATYINLISLEPYITGTAQPKMNQAKMNSIVLALPPFPEQQRILKKIGELEILCDQLELQTEHQLEAHKQLVETLLESLTRSTSHAELVEAWQRLAAHFDLLFSGPMGEWAIDRLKDTILQLAVMGKLVPQNADDEPVSVLLARIEEEKARLVAEGKLKKQMPLPPVSDEEKPFELPEGWEWIRLTHIAEINPRNEASDDLQVSFVPMALISTSHRGEHEQETREWREVKQGFTHFANGDVAIAKITPCFENSKAAVFSNLKNGIGAGTTELHVARPLGGLSPLYLLLCFKSPRYLLEGESKMTGSAGQKRLPKSYFEGTPLPLPPLAEQHRIVAKVDELFALCDQLKAKLQAANETQIKLTEAIVQQALA